MLARLGGDEFTLLLDRIHGHEEAIAIATRVADSFADPFEIAGRRFNVSASIGIATNLDGADDAEALLTQADAAQYRAKERGRNRIEVFDAELRESMQRRLGDEQELRDALAAGQIVAWFQPEVELAHRPHRRRGVARPLDAPGARGARRVAVRAARRGGRARVPARRRDRRGARSRRARRSRPRASTTRFRIWCNVSAGQFTRARPTERLVGLLERIRLRSRP